MKLITSKKDVCSVNRLFEKGKFVPEGALKFCFVPVTGGYSLRSFVEANTYGCDKFYARADVIRFSIHQVSPSFCFNLY
jgi:hypothetical protein